MALIITALIGAYVYTGSFQFGGQSEAGTEAPPIIERDKDVNSELFRVSVVELKPQTRLRTINMRGRTRADAIIPVKAQTSGILKERRVSRGDHVKEGQLVCILERGARDADLASAIASLEKAQVEYSANEQLNEQGFTTDTKMRELAASLNSAKAQVQRAQLQLDYTEIRANASGIVQDPIAETGDMLDMGHTCVTLVDRDPIYVVGQLSESEISSVEVGMKSAIELATGVTTSGEISYIAPSADAKTRTFLVEIKVAGNNQPIRDGLTARAQIALSETSAFRVSPSWLTLADDGRIGVKTLDENNQVRFQQVNIVSKGNDGFWIEDVSDGTRIITLGQEYVVIGDEVEPVMQEAMNKGSTQ